jgi:hypothetical protein
MALRSANIIGDVVDDVQESGIKLEVRFGTVQVEDGATLKPAQVGVSCECIHSPCHPPRRACLCI